MTCCSGTMAMPTRDHVVRYPFNTGGQRMHCAYTAAR